jgi:hypothetical protein
MKFLLFWESAGFAVTLLFPCKGLILLGSFGKSPVFFYLYSVLYPLAVIILLVVCYRLIRKILEKSNSGHRRLRAGCLIIIVVLFLGGCVLVPWTVVQSYALKRVVESRVDVGALRQWLIESNFGETQTMRAPVTMELEKAQVPSFVKPLHPNNVFVIIKPDYRVLKVTWGGRGFGSWELVISSATTEIQEPPTSGETMLLIQPGVYVTAWNNIEM